MMSFKFKKQMTSDQRNAAILVLKEYLGEFKAAFDIERVIVHIDINSKDDSAAYLFSGGHGSAELIERFSLHKNQEPPPEGILPG